MAPGSPDGGPRAGHRTGRPPSSGHPPVADAPGGGFGLVGLGERVRTLGGRLRAEPRLDGGFGVEAVLPA